MSVADSLGRSAGSYNRDERTELGRVIFLGTGDLLNPQRAQASLALRLSGCEVLLIDVSSGTVLLGRLRPPAYHSKPSVTSSSSTATSTTWAGWPLLTALTLLPGSSLTVHATPETLRAMRKLLELTIPGVEGWFGKCLIWHELSPGKPTRVGDAEVTPFALTTLSSASVFA